jgi:hypothetical protein
LYIFNIIRKEESIVMEKKDYVAPSIESEEVLERAALACSGVFNNNLYNLKQSYYSCGFNDS